MTRTMRQPRKQALREQLAIAADGLIAKSQRIEQLAWLVELDSNPAYRAARDRLREPQPAPYPWLVLLAVFVLGIGVGGVFL